MAQHDGMFNNEYVGSCLRKCCDACNNEYEIYDLSKFRMGDRTAWSCGSHVCDESIVYMLLNGLPNISINTFAERSNDEEWADSWSWNGESERSYTDSE